MDPEEITKSQVEFKTLHLFKDQKLGVGAYGVVYKAKCDELICAAKILHPNLFDIETQSLATPTNEHKLPIRRFEQEYKFMSSLRHPNIVQYLGIDFDPDDIRLPVLLMELMDDSLTHFLENSPQPIPYHIQVNFCHDVALALSFLHSNNIVHRDLSGNNVLLLCNVRAKVTDFGMARLDDFTSKSHQTCTMCPGTEVYMAPETVQEDTMYTEKIDCFSFGVIIVQILTQLFPKPGNRLQKVQFSHPDLPRGTLMVCVPEIDRRQNHISQIDQNNPLLQIALDCLGDQSKERPSAIQLCRRIVKLKEGPEYSQSLKANQPQSTSEEGNPQNVLELQQTIRMQEQLLKEITDQNEQITAQHHQALEQRDDIITKKCQIIEQKDEDIRFRNEENQKLKELVKERNVQLELTNQKLEDYEQLIAQFGKRIEELEQEITEVHGHRENSQTVADNSGDQQPSIAQVTISTNTTDASMKSDKKEGQTAESGNFRLKWKICRTKAPRKLRRGADIVIDGNKIYITPFKLTDTTIHVFSVSRNSWSSLPGFPYNDFSLVIYNNLPTGVGGYACGDYSNKILSLIKEGDNHRRWREALPSMPTKRYSMSSLLIKESLIVAGGNSGNGPITTVEVLNTDTHQWATAEPLLQPLYKSSATLCGDQIYLLGGEDDKFTMTNTVYSCALSALLSSCHDQARAQESKGILKKIFSPNDSLQPQIPHTACAWKRLSNLPVVHATCVSFKDKLLAVGGKDSKGAITTAVRMYNSSTDSWEVLSDMLIGRSSCSVANLDDSRLMVVGGITLYAPEKYVETDSIEVGIVE